MKNKHKYWKKHINSSFLQYGMMDLFKKFIRIYKIETPRINKIIK